MLPGKQSLRHMHIVLGDQLDPRSTLLEDFDPARDAVWMAEVTGESTKVKSHKARIALFLSAMRHFRDQLHRKKWPVIYRSLEDRGSRGTLAEELGQALKKWKPRRLVLMEPGEWHVRRDLLAAAERSGVDSVVRPDNHFLCTTDEFAEHAEGRKQLRLEFFYRVMRRRYGILMEGSKPVGGKWNFDEANRGAFPASGPAPIRAPHSFRPDALTREVLRTVEARFPDHPGSLAHFDWPVTPRQAKKALADFIEHRLPRFGPFQDAMWTGEPFLYHARLSSSLNLKLLDPRDVLEAAGQAHGEQKAPLSSVEGFIRQILGWREYVRGIYWRHMPDYREMNFLAAKAPLPGFYWTGETDMHCLGQAIGQTLRYGYAHHIQRLMVTGLFALLLGVNPREVHEWYLAVYVDAVEWVELPNTLGMSQYGDGGIMASKPYAATGKYIQRMSNYCKECRYAPDRTLGEDACPFTTLYWDFLLRHEKRLAKNPRMKLQLRNLDRKSSADRRAIRKEAAKRKETILS